MIIVSRLRITVAMTSALVWSVCAASTAVAAECPNAELRSATDRALPDCRAYEQVSPTDKNGVDVYAGETGTLPTRTPVVAADGSAVAFETKSVLPDAAAGLLINTNLSQRGAGVSGWTTQVLAAPQTPVPRPQYSLFQLYTPNLTEAVVQAPPGPSHAPNDTVGANNLYLRDNVTGAYTTLSVNPPVVKGPRDIQYRAAGISADRRHVLFTADDALTPDAPVQAALNLRSNLYEWVDGHLRLVTILPDGTPADQGGSPGGPTGAQSLTAMSADGTRIVFGTPPETQPDGAQIYLREDGQRTIEVSASQRATPDPGGSTQPTFWAASSDGSVIFFSSQTALTDDATIGAVSLYRYDVNTGKLTNLTVDADPSVGPGGGLMGVLGATPDGSQVYFQSTRQYVAGKGVAGLWNLYRWHDGMLSFVLTDDVGGLVQFEVNHKTARVTPDGRHMIFMSKRSLTGFDNTDAVTGQPDSEVFLYDAAADKLTCVSCKPDGGRPTGSSTLPEPPVRPLFNSQRGVSDDGRLVFFDSADDLVPADVNGKPDVYEYEDGAIHLISSGSGESGSVIAGSSATGDDVFFVTRDRLAQSDVDDNADMYDARVGGGFGQSAPPVPCKGDTCQGAPTPVPDDPLPGSPSVMGDGDAPVAEVNKPSFVVAALSKSARSQAARSGYVTLAVRVSRGGILRARVSRTVGGHAQTIGSAERHVPRASTVKFRVRLAKSARVALARGKRLRVSVRVSFSHVAKAKAMTVELER